MSDEVIRLVYGALMPGVSTQPLEPWVARAIANGVESVCLFTDACGSAARTRETTRALRELSSSLLIALDEESGEVTRIEAHAGSSFLSPYALGAIADEGVTRASGRLVGRMLGFAGVDWDLAPVADGNVDPRNPVIGVRSFGSDALHVAAHVAAFTEGLQSVGILACPKHFPGHGDTHVDSHEALPSLLAAEETLEERELAPFRSAIGAGASSVMTGHLLVPALDPRAPASLSHRATTEVLRGHLGFAGVVVTDAVEMGAVSGVDRSEIGGAAVAALAAGADVVCIGAADQAHALATCVAAIRSAIDDGVLDSGLLRAAALRRAAMRSARVGEEVRFTVAGDIAIVAAAAGRSVTVRADATVRTSGVDVIRIAPEPGYAAGETHWGVADPLRRAGHDVALLADGHRPIGVSGRDLVIETRDPWKDASMVARLESLLAQRPDAVVIDFGWPLEPLTGARGWITTRGTGRLSSALAVCLLSGGDPVAVSSDILHTAYVETS